MISIHDFLSGANHNRFSFVLNFFLPFFKVHGSNFFYLPRGKHTNACNVIGKNLNLDREIAILFVKQKKC